jgi:archaemetzincin
MPPEPLVRVATPARDERERARMHGHELEREPDVHPAIGPLDELDPIARRAFVDPEAFDPPPPVRPGDWRSRVDEPTQTFADFVVSRPNPLEAKRSRLVLLPWGTFPHEVVVEQEYVAIVRSPEPAWLAEFASRFFGVPCSAEPANAWDPGTLPLRIRGGHDQFQAQAILATAASSLPDDAYAMTVLVNRDLWFHDAQDFAFGYGTHRDRLAVMSFARFDPQFAGHARDPDWAEKITERSLKVLAHEMAHTFGLRHCTFYACIMGGFAHLAELDAAPLRLCPVCLRKLQHVVGFDLAARYEALRSFYIEAERTAGVARIEAEWTGRRLGRLRGTAESVR